MFDPNFSPYDAMLALNENQQKIVDRQRAQAEEIRQCLVMLSEQQQQIDILVRGLDHANKANEQLMQQLLAEMMKNITGSTQGNH